MTPAADFTTSQPEVARTTPSFSNGRPRTPARRPTTAVRRASSSGSVQPFANHNAGHLVVQPAGGARQPGVRSALYRRRRRRQRRRSHAAGAESRLGLRQDLPDRSAGHRRAPTRSTASQPETPSSSTAGALPEIYAYGVRNPQRFAWDSENGNLFVADIGQNIVEEISLVPAGANLGWNDWEGSFRFISRQAVSLENPRGDPKVTYPDRRVRSDRSAAAGAAPPPAVSSSIAAIRSSSWQTS